MTSMVLFIFLSLFKCDKTESRELFKTLSISPLLNLFDIVNISNTIILYILRNHLKRTPVYYSISFYSTEQEMYFNF